MTLDQGSSPSTSIIPFHFSLHGKKISEPIKLQLFDSTLATSGLITHHHSDMSMTMMFEIGDAQLTASLSLKSRPAPTIEGVANEDCLEPTNPESIH
ncbi:hypothetical protein C0995_004895 [Termitomyces sp. Mi166|nr:hypothetical protein C0995_004895 [Termitomyces sp. Mi166\